MEPRWILHCDLNNFFASVECALDPSLKDVPVAVCGDPNERHGIVLAKNQLAKVAGVNTAEAIWQAKSKCPNLVCVRPHYNLYLEYSRRVLAIYGRYTDLIETFGLDECWLDVTASGIFGTAAEIADRLRAEVKAETDLTISVGVSFTKSFAKLGSDMHKPNATTIITKENYKQKVWVLPAGELFMVGRKTAEELKKYNIFTIGDLANANEELLRTKFGINALKMIDSARGLDFSSVAHVDSKRDLKSVGHGTTTSRDVISYDDAERTIYFLSEMVATRLRRYGLHGKTVCLDLRFNDLSSFTRQTTLPMPSSCAKEIADTACKALLRKNWNPQKDLPLRTITVSVTSLSSADEFVQLSMFQPADREKRGKLESAMDGIRTKYGFNSIERAFTVDMPFIADKSCDDDDLLPFKR